MERTIADLQALHPLRKLLVAGVNEMLAQDAFALEPPDPDAQEQPGRRPATLFGEPALLLWFPIRHAEILVSVWWRCDPARHPLARRGEAALWSRVEPFATNIPEAPRAAWPRFARAVASGWFERKEAPYIQGEGADGLLSSCYLGHDARARLDAMPAPVPTGFKAEGRFFL
jgi:hypothetical protein